MLNKLTSFSRWIWNSPSTWVFMLLLSLYLTTMTEPILITDGLAVLKTTESIVNKRTIAVEPNAGMIQFVIGWDKQTYSFYDLGQPLLSIPFYWVGQKVARLIDPKNEGTITIWFVFSLLPKFATAMTGVIFYQICTSLFHNKATGIFLTVLWGAGTLAWPYAQFFFSESLITLFLLLACYFLIKAEKNFSEINLFLAGFSFGVAINIRVAIGIYLPAFIVYLFVKNSLISFSLPNFGKQLLLFFSGIFPAICLLAWHNYIRFHSILHTGYVGQSFTTPLYIGVYGLLFSSGRSLFLYSPLTILGLIALPDFRRHVPAMYAFIITAFVSTVPFYAKWWTWHGGWSWGPRFLVPLIPFLLIPIGSRLNSRKFIGATIILWFISILVIIPGIGVDFNQYIIDHIHGDYANENLLWFFPWESPIIGHWQYLLEGKSVIYRQSDFGTVSAWKVLTIMGIWFFISLGRVIFLWYKLVKKQTMTILTMLH